MFCHRLTVMPFREDRRRVVPLFCGVPPPRLPWSERCGPIQRRGTKPLPNLVRRHIQARLFLPLILIEQKPLHQPCPIKAADAHADEPHGKMASRKPVTEHFIGGLPQFVGDVGWLGQGLGAGNQGKVGKTDFEVNYPAS